MDASNVASRFQNAGISRSITGKLGDAGMWVLDAFAPLTGAASSGAVDSAAAAGPVVAVLSSNVPSRGRGASSGHSAVPPRLPRDLSPGRSFVGYDGLSRSVLPARRAVARRALFRKLPGDGRITVAGSPAYR